MDLRKIKKLIELVEESGIAELEVSSGDESIRIARYGAAQAVPMSDCGVSDPGVSDPGLDRSRAGPPPSLNAPTGTEVTAPMAGVFYAAPAPDAEPFVRVGQAVAPGDVVCIIESMKMMNEIKAETGGTCGEIFARSGQAVASGDPLFRLI